MGTFTSLAKPWGKTGLSRLDLGRDDLHRLFPSASAEVVERVIRNSSAKATTR
jgi:hypothetical protein